MKKDKFGNIILPKVQSWMDAHKHVSHYSHEYSPVPNNVFLLPSHSKRIGKKIPKTKLGKEWSLLSEYTEFGDTEQDFIRYDGNSRWTMRSINVLGDESITKRYGTKALINWVTRRETKLFDDDILPSEECEFERRLGIVLSNLLLIAMRERADYCVQCIGRILRREPLVKPKLTKLQITEIKGVTIKGVWIRRYAAFFVAETPDGDVYLSPPDKQGITSGFGPGIKNTGVRNPAKNVQLTKRVCFQIDALKDDFIECCREAMAKNGY